MAIYRTIPAFTSSFVSPISRLLTCQFSRSPFLRISSNITPTNTSHISPDRSAIHSAPSCRRGRHSTPRKDKSTSLPSMPTRSERPTLPKSCASCGRTIEWRKKWERNWDSVRYCSEACRKRKIRTIDERLENAILDLLAARTGGTTICPSEAARKVVEDPADESQWRPLMEAARMAARRLVSQGKVHITQKGKVVDPSTAKGPIRIRLAD